MKKVRFKDVGRDKDTWEAETPVITFEWLEKQVRPHLLSSEVTVYFDVVSRKGKVIVGWGRVVGEIEVIE